MTLTSATNPLEHFSRQQQRQSWKKKGSGRGAAVNTTAMIGERMMKGEKLVEADESQYLDSLQLYEIKSYLDPETPDRDKDDRLMSRRTVYDHSDWLRHRSSMRHVRHIMSIASSRVVRALGPPVMSLTFLSFLVTLFNEAILTGGLPPWMPVLRMSSLPFQLTAPVLALLLVFRTNASYARFDEARKLWGAILNRMRDVTRQLLTWLPNSDVRAEALRHLVALPLCLKDHLTREETLREELMEVLEEKEVEAVMAAKHRPLFILQTLSHILQSAPLTGIQRAIMEQSLSSFMDVMGSCERIYKTPIPLSYTRLTSRFLVIWHAALPFALWDQCNWTAVPATLLSAAALFCIEEVGVHIEEPFSILPLDSICQVARTGARDLEAAHNGIAARRHERHDSMRMSNSSPPSPSPSLSPPPSPTPHPPGTPIPPNQTGRSNDVATQYSSAWVFPASDPDPLPSLALEDAYRFGEGERRGREKRRGARSGGGGGRCRGPTPR